ncbi:2',3'-cyclic-nucleotide 3'-phosphodiesterase [Sparassis latifolia]
MGTSLWLVPSSTIASKIERLMRISPPSAKSPSSFPRFDPHITLTTVPPSTELSRLLEAIPEATSVIPVRFKSLDVGDKYFMSVYVSVHESPELMALRTHLRQTLGERTVPPISHMSLYYIDDADREERAHVAETLRSTGRVVEIADGVMLNCQPLPVEGSAAEDGNGNGLEGFDGAEIWVAKCDGHPREWAILHKVPLCPA